MQLFIAYRSGETRIIGLTPSFFTTDTFRTNKGMKVVTPADKATDIAFDLGYRPYLIKLDRNGSVQLDRKIHANEPPVLAKLPVVSEKDIKKKLRREFKHVPFTSAHKLQF